MVKGHLFNLHTRELVAVILHCHSIDTKKKHNKQHWFLLNAACRHCWSQHGQEEAHFKFELCGDHIGILQVFKASGKIVKIGLAV